MKSKTKIILASISAGLVLLLTVAVIYGLIWQKQVVSQHFKITYLVTNAQGAVYLVDREPILSGGQVVFRYEDRVITMAGNWQMEVVKKEIK